MLGKRLGQFLGDLANEWKKTGPNYKDPKLELNSVSYEEKERRLNLLGQAVQKNYGKDEVRYADIYKDNQYKIVLNDSYDIPGTRFVITMDMDSFTNAENTNSIASAQDAVQLRLASTYDLGYGIFDPLGDNRRLKPVDFSDSQYADTANSIIEKARNVYEQAVQNLACDNPAPESELNI